MSRSGYSDDCENLGLWRGAVEKSIKGKRGQAFLKEMLVALDSLPEKKLIENDYHLDMKNKHKMLHFLHCSQAINRNNVPLSP